MTVLWVLHAKARQNEYFALSTEIQNARVTLREWRDTSD